MNKIVTILIIGVFLLNGLNAAAFDEETKNDENILTKTLKINVSQPKITEEEKFVQVSLPEQTTYLYDEGKPALPIISKTITLPIGSNIKEAEVRINQAAYSIPNRIEPSPIFLPIGYTSESTEENYDVIDETIYNSNSLYPSEKYSVNKRIGIENDKQVIYITTHCYTQYNPLEDMIYTPKTIDITIDYEPPVEPLFSENLYDMLIITTERFTESLQPLVDHKNEVGIKTKIETVEEIYEDYHGASDCEEVKLCIADARENLGIKYVLLAGGHKGQTHDWWVPDFRSHNWDPADTYDPPYDETYSSDLYFADLYRYSGSGMPIFDDWDTDNDGIYAEGPRLNPGESYDEPDYIPDVYIGRLPFRYSWEVPIAVNKIIDYERNADDSWFKKAVLAGGDGFPPERYGSIADPTAWEGEIVCNEFANLLSNKGIESTKCYCSNKGDIVVEDSDDVYNEISKGCGFVHLTGHASPFVLGSYTPGTGISPHPPLVPFYTGLNVRQFDNEGKLPFMINEGCHNAQFDVTGQELIEYLLSEDTSHILLSRNEWIPHDASSWFVLQEGGGAIAVIGNTGLGLGGLNFGTTEGVGGWIMLRFAHAYSIQDKQHTGTVWAQGITDYITNWPVLTDMGDRKTIEERALLGDPSVKLGGYHLGEGSPYDDNETEPLVAVSIDTPIWEVGDQWTYHLNTIDFELDEVEDRTIDIKLETGDIVFEIVEATSDRYIVELSSEDINLSLNLNFDTHIEGIDPIVLPETTLQHVQLNGQMILDKETTSMRNLDISLEMDIGDNLDGLPVELPAFISKIEEYISIPAVIELSIGFEESFPLLKFPLETENLWGIPEVIMSVSIDGSVESIWLRILNFVNKIVPLLPDAYAKYLPVIDISEILNDFGMDSEYEIELKEMEEYEDTPFFEVKGLETIETSSQTYDAAAISILEGNGMMYYSETVKNVVKITCPLSEYIPIIEDINLELVDTSIQ